MDDDFVKHVKREYEKQATRWRKHIPWEELSETSKRIWYKWFARTEI